MATFNYTGNARIQWGSGKTFVQFIDFDAEVGMLQVWEGDVAEPVYRGPIGEHPAELIRFPVYEPVTL